MPYKCLKCGNTETFIASIVEYGSCITDNEGDFIEMNDNDSSYSEIAPEKRCNECGSMNVDYFEEWEKCKNCEEYRHDLDKKGICQRCRGEKE